MSNTINVTLELRQEDRERLDLLTSTLIALGGELISQNAPILMDEKKFRPIETPQETQEAPKPEAVEESTPETVVAATPEPEPIAPVEEPKPTVTLDQIRQKITVLMAAGGAKKTGARDIVKSYAPNVTGLKEHEDKWPEIWDKLTALEG